MGEGMKVTAKHQSVIHLDSKRLKKLRDRGGRGSSAGHKKRRSSSLRLGSVVGSATGEADHDPVPGGWEGTDDATSTSPSDLAQIRLTPSGTVTTSDVEREQDEAEKISEMEEIDVPVWRPDRTAGS